MSRDLRDRASWRERTRYAYRNFLYAPPAYPQSPRWPVVVEKPFENAESWQCSVYYYWWAYLRENDTYRATCEAGGKGECSDVYRYLGDVHAGDFHQWWFDTFFLFTDHGGRQQFSDEIEGGPDWQPETITVELPIAYSLETMQEAAAQKVADLYLDLRRERLSSRIKFKVAQRPFLSSLHQTLEVWKIKKASPKLDDSEIADRAGLVVRPIDGTDRELREANAAGESPLQLENRMRRKKMLAVQRQLRIARQYIENVGKGQFPLRDKR